MFAVLFGKLSFGISFVIKLSIFILPHITGGIYGKMTVILLIIITYFDFLFLCIRQNMPHT